MTVDDGERQYESEVWDDEPGTFAIEHVDDFEASAARGAIARELFREDDFGHVGETWDNGYEDRRRPVKTVREVCELCAWPLNLPRGWSSCEFATQRLTSATPVIIALLATIAPTVAALRRGWLLLIVPYVEGLDLCSCNGCLRPTPGSMGRPMYCSDQCKHRMKLARERAYRRAEGAKTWSSDFEADRLVAYRPAICALAQKRKASDHYPRW